VQGVHQIVFACAVRPIANVFYFNRSEGKASEMMSLMKTHHPDVKLVKCETADEVVKNASAVIAATTSATPVFSNDEHLVRGKHFISIGSYKPSMQELPDMVYQLAGDLVIDSAFARHETGDIINPINKDFIKEENVYTIGKLLTGKRKLDASKTTIFKSAGMALFDLYVAQAMYEEAIRRNIGTNVDF
jgi:ornithine cyclodeaminase